MKDLILFAGGYVPNEANKEERIALLRPFYNRFLLFESEGFDAQLVEGPSTEHFTHVSAWFKREDPSLVFSGFVDGSLLAEQVMQGPCWPRDAFQFLGDTLFIAPHYTGLQSGLEALTGKEAIISYWGEGGLYMPLDKDSLFYAFCDPLHNNCDLVEDQGFSTFPLPLPHQQKGIRAATTLLENRLLNGHVSTEISLAKNDKNDIAISITPDYHFFLEWAFPQIMAGLHKLGEVFICPEPITLQPANQPTLPDGRVMIPAHCKSTAAFLKRRLGKESVLEVPLTPGETSELGGLQCKTNVIPGYARKA